MFGEGKHPHIERIYAAKLAPFMSQTSHNFWKSRLHYFKTGLYYHGGMVRHRRTWFPLNFENLSEVPPPRCSYLQPIPNLKMCLVLHGHARTMLVMLGCSTG